VYPAKTHTIKNIPIVVTSYQQQVMPNIIVTHQYRINHVVIVNAMLIKQLAKTKAENVVIVIDMKKMVIQLMEYVASFMVTFMVNLCDHIYVVG
jgi:hypothetical protein